jgi:hypothetical protein
MSGLRRAEADRIHRPSREIARATTADIATYANLTREQRAIMAPIIEAQIAAQRRREVRERFRETYHDDAERFTMECFDWSRFPGGNAPTPYQRRGLRKLVEDKRVAFVGPHGLGKTAFNAWVWHWFVATRDGHDEWKGLTTAGSWKQLIAFLWPEIRMWTRYIKWDVLGRPPYDRSSELLQLRFNGATGIAEAVAPTDPTVIEGAHATEILFQYDESKSIADQLFDATEGAFSQAGPNTGRNAFLVATSTPGEPRGRFYNICKDRVKYSDWQPIHVTFEETVAAGLNDEEWRAKRKIQWGERSPIYINRVLGQFVEEIADGVIPLSSIERALGRWHEDGVILPDGSIDRRRRRRSYGLDPADSGDDMAATCELWETELGHLWCAPLDYSDQDDPIATSDRVISLTMATPSIPIGVDVVGIGAAIPPYLRKSKRRPVPFIATQAANRRDKTGVLQFGNMRAWGWWHLRDLLAPTSEVLLALPADERLEGDLSAPKYHERGGRIFVESKEEIRRADRLGHSTDGADALIIAAACDAIGSTGFLDGAKPRALKRVRGREMRLSRLDHSRLAPDRHW